MANPGCFLCGAKIASTLWSWIHEIACPSENEIYVAEILNWRVQKLILHPTAAMSTSSK
jgi:hypothetical protein